MSLETEKNINNPFQDDGHQNEGLRVLMISTDRNIFKSDSAVRKRMAEYGKLFRELRVIIFTKRSGNFEPEKISGNVWVYPTKSWSRLFYPFDAVKIVKKEFGKSFPEMINIISTQDPFETGIAGWILARKFQLPLQMQIHTDFLSPYFWKESFLNKIRVIVGKFLVKKADGIRVVSNRIKNSLILKPNTYNLKPKITVLPIFVDIEKIKITLDNFDARKKYPQFSFIIMMASRLEKEKNIVLAIEMMRELVRNNPKIGLVIVGDGREKNKLKRLVAKYGLDKNVIFEGWQNDLISYYKTSDVFLSTSLYEGYGLTIIESLACGCPVVSSDVGIADEIIIDGENGFICPVNDRNCFTRKIQEIMETPSLKERFSVNSNMIISDKLKETKENYLKRYKETLMNCYPVEV